MTTAIAKTLLDTLELRAGSVITASEIAALKKRWRPLNRAVQDGRIDVAQESADLYDALPMRVCDEQALRGLDYLRKLLLRKDGTVRNTKLALDQGVGDDHATVINTLDHFLFVGFRWDWNQIYTVAWPQPIYRAVAHDGQWFEYVARAWTAGTPTFGQLGIDVSREQP
jgi:hypothetical protein